MFDTIEQARLSELHIASDPDSQLRAIIAVHSTHLGPALGGCRCISYPNETAAIEDAIRLAKGMSYKAALAELPLGGGKSVILKPSTPFDRHQLYASFGRFVDTLGGRYITAVDSGSTAEDIEVIAQHTDHVVGTRALGGDPSPITALGVFEGILSCIKITHGQDTLTGIHIAIQGLGNVGYPLAEMLHQAGARLTVADIDTQRVQMAQTQLGAKAVSPDQIHKVECDLFAPCGLGAIINETTLPQLRCKAIAGSANNQLAEDKHGDQLIQQGIVYAPDYIINAGGLIHVCLAKQGASATEIERKTRQIGQTVSEVLHRAQQEGLSSSVVADQIAEERLLQHNSNVVSSLPPLSSTSSSTTSSRPSSATSSPTKGTLACTP